jgi:hypothetical protein
MGAWAAWLAGLCCAVLCWCVEERGGGHQGKRGGLYTSLAFEERDQPSSFFSTSYSKLTKPLRLTRAGNVSFSPSKLLSTSCRPHSAQKLGVAIE